MTPNGKSIVLRTHGGLGNQIFQVLYGRLLSKKFNCGLFEAHDSHYAHRFSRSSEVAKGPAPTGWRRVYSAARIPKLRKRISGADGPICISNTIFLDGYFQDVDLFRGFAPSMLQSQLLIIRDELKIVEGANNRYLIHLRLGDFFGCESEQLGHALDRLNKIEAGAHIISNREDILRCEPFAERIASAGAVLLRTDGLTAEDVLRLMSTYRIIDANNSTLAFWASVFAGSEITLSYDRLRDARDFFRSRLAIA